MTSLKTRSTIAPDAALAAMAASLDPVADLTDPSPDYVRTLVGGTMQRDLFRKLDDGTFESVLGDQSDDVVVHWRAGFDREEGPGRGEMNWIEVRDDLGRPLKPYGLFVSYGWENRRDPVTGDIHPDFNRRRYIPLETAIVYCADDRIDETGDLDLWDAWPEFTGEKAPLWPISADPTADAAERAAQSDLEEAEGPAYGFDGIDEDELELAP